MSAEKEPQKSEVAKREEDVLAFWDTHEIFQKTVEREPSKGEYVFYDGPPFATGLPHYGHLLQSFVKDVIPRYKTMQGYRVERQWGWDCHGLPIENIVEKELGTKSKKDIMQMGVKKFNDLCRKRIFTFIGEWVRIIPRIGRFVDMKHAYRTMDFSYMESEWWAFKTLHEKGLIYEDYRSMHICPRCETTLSQGEVAEGYKDVKDLSVTVKFKVKPGQKIGEWEVPENTYLLAWTTTPWTLPGNVALAINSTFVYLAVKAFSDNTDNTYLLLKDALLDHLLKGEGALRYSQLFSKDDHHWLGGAKDTHSENIKEIPGQEMLGLEYAPLFDYYAKDEKLKNRENGWKVYEADFVTTDTGTGIVHIAPAFGADDMALGKRENLPFVQHVKMDGTFAPETGEFAGIDLKPRAKGKPEEIREADLAIVRHLEEKGLVFSHEKYEHAYPHCWRCDTALLNYATSSWFVAVEKMKPTLLEAAQSINWSPEHIKEGRFGKWLEGARDWSISRQRFWANTIPVWRCDTCKRDHVFGSAAELAQASGSTVSDLHKDVVDEIAFKCKKSDLLQSQECDGIARRVPDVLDTWFDSGSVPFATEHYPHENAERFVARMPADFIGEAQDQTRAWFYYLHVLSGGLFGKAAFKNCIVTGLVLAEDGKKMSKKLNNYPDPMTIVDRYGADALRLYVLSAPIVQGENLNFSEHGVDEALKKNIGRLHNVLSFYQLYAPSTKLGAGDVLRGHTSTHLLDQWILSRLALFTREVTAGMEAYQLDAASRPIPGFIDDLSVWYIRRSRDRFKATDETTSSSLADKQAALATLRYVLHTLARVIAPIMPFYAEYLFQAVCEDEDEESVHMTMWPDASQMQCDTNLLLVMEQARRIVSMALEERDKAGIKVRQPLSRLSVSAEDALRFSKDLLDIIAEEVNVKEVSSGSALSLDISITPELREEGFIREFTRYVQQRRKDMQLMPSDAIRLFVPENEVIRRSEASLRKTLNTVEIVFTSEWQGAMLSLDEKHMLVGVERVA